MTLDVLALNLPHAGGTLQRRYVASYYAPNFLVPPLELMGLASVARERTGATVRVHDAIAKGQTLEAALADIAARPPDVIATLLGFGSFAEDVSYLDAIKARFPKAKLVAAGYLPSQRPLDVMANTRLDALLLEEPEHPFAGYLGSLAGTLDAATVPGLVVRDGDRVVSGPPPKRLTPAELDRLPFPDHALVDRDAYSESFLGRPIAAVLSARGCPYQCTYCVRMYGMKFVTRSAENILAELAHLSRTLGIRNIRFMDDTFTLVPTRLKAICKGMIDAGLDLRWTCLTRLDCLDAEGVALMKKSGCKRIYCGIESGSQRLLDHYKKALQVSQIEAQIKLARKGGIEVSAFFIVGAPGETEEDFEASVALARTSGVDYVIVTRMQYWPGTEMYTDVAGGLDFSLFPYRVKFAGDGDENFYRREREFYRRFYFRPSYALKRIPHLLRTPRDIARGFFELARYVGSPAPRRDFI